MTIPGPRTPVTPMDKWDWLIGLLSAAALMAWLFPFAHLGIDPHHDGIMLKPALDVLSGQTLFRDTFTQYGALSTYLQVLALRLQPSLLTLRLMTVGMYGISLFILYAAWRLILPRSLTIVACALFILFLPGYEKNWLNQYWILLPWSSVHALMFQSIALYALLNVVRQEQAARWAVMLGLATACIFWCRQPAGILTAGALLVIWLALSWTGWKPVNESPRRIMNGILGGFFGVHLLILGGIWLSGAGPAWWYQNFVWPGKYASLVGDALWRSFSRDFLHPAAAGQLLGVLLAVMLPGILSRLGPRLSSRFVVVWYVGVGIVLAWQWTWLRPVLDLRAGGWTLLLPAVLILLALASLGQGFAGRNRPKPADYHLVAAGAALSLCSLVQYYPVADTWHTTWALAPTFGLIVFAGWRWSGWPASFTVGLVIAAFLPSLCTRIEAARRALAEPSVTLASPAVLRGMQVPPAQARMFTEIATLLDRVLKARPDIPSALVGNDALYLCFTPNRTNPVPYYVTWGGLTDHDVDLQRWTQILRTRSLIFFLKPDWSWANDFYHRTGYVPLVYFPDAALEIAVPPEVADAMGVTTYGAPKAKDAPKSPP
jgi:hypothetical protein